MKRLSRHRALALFMAMVTLFMSVSPCLPVIALDDYDETSNENGDYESEFSANVGNWAVFDWWAEFLLANEETLISSTADEMSDYYGNSEIGYENWVSYDDIPANDLVLKIADYYYDEVNCFHWYKVTGDDLPQILQEKPWVFYSDDLDLEYGTDPYLAIYDKNDVVRIVNVDLETASSVRFVFSGPADLADATIKVTDYYGDYSVSSLAYNHEESGTWSSAINVEITKANKEMWYESDGIVSVRYTSEQIATNNYTEEVCYGAAYLYIDGRVYSAAVTDKMGYDCSDVVYTGAGSSIIVYELMIPSLDWFDEYGYFAEDAVTIYDNRFGSKYCLSSELPLEVHAGYIFTDEEGVDWYWLEGKEFVGTPYFLVKADDVTIGEYPEEFGDGRVSVVDTTGNAVSSIIMPQYRKLELTANTSLSRYSSDVAYRWQIEYEDDKWVNIYGEYSDKIKLTYGMIASLLKDDGTVDVRCKTSAGRYNAYSRAIPVTLEIYDPDVEISENLYKSSGETVSVTVSGNIPSDATVELEETDSEEFEIKKGESILASIDISVKNANGTEWQSEDDETTDEKCTVTVYFMAGEGTTGLLGKLPSPISSTYGKGTTINSVAFDIPVITGYSAYIGEDTEASAKVVVPDGTVITSDIVYYVYYKPTQTTYTVKHYQQNAYDDSYTLVEGDTKTYTGITEQMTSAVANVYEGFYNLVFVQAVIAGDGSTVIEVYYNRYYYLMKFNLDGGYGVDPIYARQGSAIKVNTPVKPGYAFAGWYLDSDPAKEIVDLPDVMPSYSSGYVATWSVSEASYTIAYWIQNPNNATQYDYVYSLSNAGFSGDAIDWTLYKTISEDKVYDATNDSSLYRYITLNEEKSVESNADLTIAGDGSSVVNVYYDRKGYTLRFYYAMSSGNKYYVVGGSTYAFGSTATISDKGNEIKLIDHYMSDYASQRGEVATLPALKSGVTGYTKGTVKSTVASKEYTYYYISFDAKYGADISELWPSDKFDSVTSINTTSGSWSGNQAFVSAWNGEHHVKYSQKNANQTIKGKYAQLDENLLWAPEYGDPSDGIVSYLCFWENGATVNWNIPELYRYNIYVEGYAGYAGEEKYNYAYKTYNGKKYYLIDQYNTCDDSNVANQTQPAVTGYTAVGKSDDVITNFDTSLYAEAHDVFFFYKRNDFVLEFNNPDYEKYESVKYQEVLDGYDYIPDPPLDSDGDSIYEEGSVYFNGWYTSPECIPETKFDLSAETMPANNVMLYASWIPQMYTVNIWMSSELSEHVVGTATNLSVYHGSTMNLYIPPEPENGNWTFDGWFYIDDVTGEEKAFDFENSQIKQNMDIYAKWSASEAIAYKVNYIYVDNGTETEIAPATTGSELAGKTLTFFAKGGNNLYPQFRGQGYFSTSPSHSITLDLEYAEDVQEVTFYYVKRDPVEYVVRYYEVDDNGNTVVDSNGVPIPLATPKTIMSYDAVVTENAKIISGHTPDSTQKTLVIDINSETNEIIFYYHDNPYASFYRVTHYVQSYGSDLWTEYKKDEYSSVIHANVAPPAISIDGYTLNESISVTSGTVTKNGLDLEFYYVENSATINYVPVGPQGAVNFGSVSSTKETLGALTGVAQGSTAAVSQNAFEFVGWYSDADCKNLISTNAEWKPSKYDGEIWVDGVTYYAKFKYKLTSLTIKNITTDSGW